MRIHFVIIMLSLCVFSYAQVPGCTDSQALNYNPLATLNDGSCTYGAVSVLPDTSIELAISLNESSGLLFWNNTLLTHNDNTDTLLYAIDTASATILQTYPVSGVNNNDWEEISQDDNYLYIGDFGNNAYGNRTNLHILRISKASLLSGNPIADSINFVYENQTDFTPAATNNTDFDCEAFIVTSDSIFLFSKQWLSHKTTLYALPKTPGSYTATLKDSFDVQGLITGATYLEQERIVALCGYSQTLQPFILICYDFQGNDFFGANKRKLGVSLPQHQTEGIATANGLKYYLTNEKLYQPPYVNTIQKLHTIDLTAYLLPYLLPTGTLSDSQRPIRNIVTYPNPSHNTISIISKDIPLPYPYSIVSLSGVKVMEGVVGSELPTIDISFLADGVYFFVGRNGDAGMFVKE